MVVEDRFLPHATQSNVHLFSLGIMYSKVHVVWKGFLDQFLVKLCISLP